MKNDLAKNLPLALHLHFWYLFGDFNYQLLAEKLSNHY
jgi:hypothetical protein